MSTLLEKKRILDSLITNASFDTVVDQIAELGRARQSAYVCLTNVHMVMEAHWDAGFRKVHERATIATPDGKPVAVFMNRIYGTDQEQIAGENLMIRTFERAEEEGLSIFFLGSTDDVLEAMKRRLNEEYPRLKIAGTLSPPFRPLSDEEESEIVDTINESGAHILMVALGCPKQENWMARYEGRIHAVMLGVGAAFPFFTGHVQRAPVWMQNYCLEWFYRLCREPRRLFMRYFMTNIPFLFLITVQWISHRLGLGKD